jgi:hypothetical protein
MAQKSSHMVKMQSERTNVLKQQFDYMYIKVFRDIHYILWHYSNEVCEI